MLRQSGTAGRLLVQLAKNRTEQAAGAAIAGVSAQQFRFIGGDKVPEFWGKPSSYTEGTAFLGTPKNHLEIIQKRPLSPDVIDIDGKNPHYKFPWGALSSITNRVTGVAMWTGFTTAGYISLTGNLPAFVAGVAATNPILLFPFKFAVAYTIFYHYLGGVRHLVWDHHKIGNQADKNSLLEVPQVEVSSKALFGASAVLSLICGFL